MASLTASEREFVAPAATETTASRTTPAARKPTPVAEFSPSESWAAPVVMEETGDSAWRQFEALLNADKVDFDSTQSTLHEPRNGQAWQQTAASPLSAPNQQRLHLEAALNDVLALARTANRAAPVEDAWRKMYLLLPKVEHGGRTFSPPVPLPAEQGTWIQRRLRLRDQIEWAELAGCLREVHAFLDDLPESDWDHFGGSA